MVQTTHAREEFMTSGGGATTLPRTAKGMPGWLGLFVVLALIAASFAGGFFTGRATGPDLGLAPQSIVDTIDDAIRLSNAGDEAGYAALWAEDAVFTNLLLNQSSDTVGASAIAADYVPSSKMERTSEVIQQGDFYAYGCSEAHSKGLVVLRFDDEGLMSHLWLIGLPRRGFRIGRSRVATWSHLRSAVGG